MFLLGVSLTPFSTMFLAEFVTYRLALVVYWRNLLLLGVTLYFSWVCAPETGVVKADLSPHVTSAIKRRIVIGASPYMHSGDCCACSVATGA